MPLAIGVRIGEDFYVGDERFVVQEVDDLTHFTLVHHNKRIRITDERSTEILPKVMVSAGISAGKNWAKVTVSAPHEIPIVRGEVYRERGGQHASGD